MDLSDLLVPMTLLGFVAFGTYHVPPRITSFDATHFESDVRKLIPGAQKERERCEEFIESVKALGGIPITEGDPSKEFFPTRENALAVLERLSAYPDPFVFYQRLNSLSADRLQENTPVDLSSLFEMRPCGEMGILNLWERLLNSMGPYSFTPQEKVALRRAALTFISAPLRHPSTLNPLWVRTCLLIRLYEHQIVHLEKYQERIFADLVEQERSLRDFLSRMSGIWRDGLTPPAYQQLRGEEKSSLLSAYLHELNESQSIQNGLKAFLATIDVS